MANRTTTKIYFLVLPFSFIYFINFKFERKLFFMHYEYFKDCVDKEHLVGLATNLNSVKQFKYIFLPILQIKQ